MGRPTLASRHTYVLFHLAAHLSMWDGGSNGIVKEVHAAVRFLQVRCAFPPRLFFVGNAMPQKTVPHYSTKA